MKLLFENWRRYLNENDNPSGFQAEAYQNVEYFATGYPVTLKYTHRQQPRVDMGTQFGQHIEPHGMYVVHGHHGQEGEHEESSLGNEPFTVKTIHGIIKINNPLVVQHGGYGENGWKQRLVNLYNGKIGEELSMAIMEDGHDAIITVDSYTSSAGKDTKEVSEIVLLGISR